MKKKKLLQLLSGALTAAILISGNGVAVAAQELNGTAGEYAQAEQTEEAAVQTEETEQTEEIFFLSLCLLCSLQPHLPKTDAALRKPYKHRPRQWAR